jgi:peroxiredoxin Q/BCP
MNKLSVGQKAPDFEAVNQDGKTIRLADFTGKTLILYFYPKDNTPGCTAEACNLNDNYSALTSNGFKVVGVSPDSPASHQKFIAKYTLAFNLIADTDHKIMKSYHAWGEKKMYGKSYEGVLRKTYIIDPNGIIMAVVEKVDTKNHVAQILEIVKK